MCKKDVLKTISCLLVLVVVPSGANATFIYDIVPGNYDGDVECTGVTPGVTELLSWSEVPAVTQRQIDSVAWAYPGNDYYTGLDELRYNKAEDPEYSDNRLAGTLTIDWYKAAYSHGIPQGETEEYCYHGAEMSIHYDPAPTDPSTLFWIQFWSEPDSGIYDVVDARILDSGEPEDPWPGYFVPPNEVPWNFWHLLPNNPQPDNPAAFYNRPGLATPDPSWKLFGDDPYTGMPEARPHDVGDNEFYLFLASFETDNYWDEFEQEVVWYHQITFHEGLKWGFRGDCTPEPAALSLLAFGGLALLRRRKS